MLPSVLFINQNLFFMNSYFKFFATVIVFFIGGIVSIHAQEKSNTMDSKHEVDMADNKEDQLLQDYTWLQKIIDQKDCQGHQVSVYKMKKGDTKFVFVDEGFKRVMYDESGNIYCTNSDELDCVQFYELAPTGDKWYCATE